MKSLYDRLCDIICEVDDLETKLERSRDEVKGLRHELMVCALALQLACERISKSEEEPNPAVELFINLAIAELEIESNTYNNKGEDNKGE